MLAGNICSINKEIIPYLRPGNCILANAYAASAVTITDIIPLATETIMEFRAQRKNSVCSKAR